jgi:hypothetical protein
VVLGTVLLVGAPAAHACTRGAGAATAMRQRC